MAKKDKDKKSGGFGGFTSVRDMFDGGGAGRSGDTFQGGGLISAVGNAARVAPRGYHDNNSGGGSGQSQSRAAPAQRGRAVSDRGILDFFDGGGLGARGSSFQGLPISTIFNTMGMRPQGSQVANPQQQVGLYDYVDGGGFGQSGQAFQGSPYSMLANALGVNPMGYEERMAAARPQARSAAAPAAYSATSAEAPTATSIDAAPQVDVTPLDPIGAMPIDMLIQIANQGIDKANQPQMDFVPTNTLEYGDPLGREVNPLYVNYPFMRY